MSLSSQQLDAFSALARAGSFTRAARALHLTQPALSQRIGNLEDELGGALFVRGREGARLTALGERLLAFAQAREALEGELLGELGQGRAATAAGLTGALRVAGFSSVLRSLVLPALAPLARRHPALRLELGSRELGALPGALRRGEAELVVSSERIERAGTEIILLGHEALVLVEARGHKPPRGTFLDHDAEDQTTVAWLRSQGRAAELKRRVFLGDIYGLLDGVEQGLGRAVVPEHLAAGRRGLRVLGGRGARSLSPVYLHAPSVDGGGRTRAQRAAIEALTRYCAERLARS